MRKLFIPAIICIFMVACNSDKTESSDKMASGSTDSTAKKTPAPYEFADQKYVDIGKKNLAEFQSGNIDGWLGAFADNAKYYWSGGDSLVGKQAITDYWKNRRGNVIKSINFTNDIWYPIKINTPQKGPDAAGDWLFSYYQVNVEYNTGKSLEFWTHTLYHFDGSDKIDIAVQFIDFAPINKALGKK